MDGRDTRGDVPRDEPGASQGQQGDDDLRLLADSARDFAMIFTDPERNVVRWSRGAEAVLGWTEEEAVGASESDLIFTPEDRAAGVPQREQGAALRDGRAEDERWHVKKDGTRFFASGVMVPLYDPGTRELRGFGKVLRDVTDKMQAQEARSFLAAIVESSHDSVVTVDFDGVVTTWNRAAERLYGRTAREAVGRPLAALTLPENLREVLDGIDAVRRGEEVALFRSVRFHKDGRRMHLEVAMSPVRDGRDAGGRIIGVSTLARDVTEYRRVEEELRRSEERHRLIVEGARDYAIITTDPEGTVTGWSPGAEAVFGWGAGEAVGRTVDVTFTPEDRQAGAPEGERTTAAREGAAPDVRWHQRKDGARVFIDGMTRALREEGGALRGFLKVGQDVTERKRAEEALRESEARLSAVFSRAAVGLSEVGLDGRFLRVNDELCRILGRTREELLALGVPDVTHPDDVLPSREALARAAETAGPASLDKRYLQPDGGEVWANSSATLLQDEAGRPHTFLVVTADISERKRYEEWLQHTNELLEERVGERTAALAQSNRELARRTAELDQRSESLSAALTALEASLAEQRASEAARRELTRRVVVAQEEERRRISRELHDEMGQLLTGFSLRLRALEGVLSEPEAASSLLSELRGLADRMGKEVHRLAVELRPTSLDDVGLVPALAAYVEEWQQRTGVPAEFAAAGLDGGRLPPLIETTVYRVAQEALNNAAKYAVPGGATRVSVTLQRRDGQLLATVEDDGPGFDASGVGSGDSVPAAAGADGRPRLGLLGMRERAALAGGTLQIESAPGEGVTVFLRLPLPAPPAAGPQSASAPS